MNAIFAFEAMCGVCGLDATESQVNRMIDFVRENIGSSDYLRAAEMALYSNTPMRLYTGIMELCGEAGVCA